MRVAELKASQSLPNLARAYRGEADILKHHNKMKKSGKKIDRGMRMSEVEGRQEAARRRLAGVVDPLPASLLKYLSCGRGTTPMSRRLLYATDGVELAPTIRSGKATDLGWQNHPSLLQQGEGASY